MAKDDKYFRGKDKKLKDINRALTTRARRRIAYFKMLKAEGMAVPEKPGQRDGGETDGDAPAALRREPSKREKAKQFKERMLQKKERKQRERTERLERNQQKLSEMRASAAKREQKKTVLKSARTQRGQPLMGPRIGSLLDKIKADKGL